MLLALRALGNVLPELVNVPDSVKESMVTATVSFISKSVTVTAPLVDRVVSVSVSSAVSLPSSIVGVSLVPVIVMLTIWVSLA